MLFLISKKTDEPFAIRYKHDIFITGRNLKKALALCFFPENSFGVGTYLTTPKILMLPTLKHQNNFFLNIINCKYLHYSFLSRDNT